MAYGGGGGGYTGEQNDWAVGVLDDDDPNEDPRVHWVRPGPREAPAAAYTRAQPPRTAARCIGVHARYIPADVLDMMIFRKVLSCFWGARGGHERHSTTSNSGRGDVTWLTDEGGGELPAEPREARAPSAATAALVEYDNQAYVVFVGGGQALYSKIPTSARSSGT